MPRRLVWEKNWLRQHGWTSVQIEALEQSADLTPVEYLTGRAGFHDFEVEVNRHVLIPRVETEQLCALVAAAVGRASIGDSFNDITVYDIGCGSGAPTLDLARRLAAGQYLGVDISASAVKLAQRNATLLDVSGRVHFAVSDLLAGIDFAAFPPAREFFIMANLPYIPTQDYEQLDNCVREFEPRLALDGGPDGAQFIRRLLAQTAVLARLPQGIFLEVDPSHDLSLVADYPQWHWRRERDINGLWRYLIGEV